MSIYYIKQNNTVWCCEEDSGPHWEQIEISFVKCECLQIEPGKMADHLQGHQGGGQVLKWRKANHEEVSAWYGGKDEVFDEGIEFERERIIKLLTEAKAEKLTPEKAISKGWKFDKPTGIWWLPQETLITLIKGENK